MMSKIALECCLVMFLIILGVNRIRWSCLRRIVPEGFESILVKYEALLPLRHSCSLTTALQVNPDPHILTAFRSPSSHTPPPHFTRVSKKKTFTMQLFYYLYILALYSLLIVTQYCRDICTNNIFCSSLMPIRLAIPVYHLVDSSCQILVRNEILAGCSNFAWSAAGGTYFLNAYVREYPEMVTRWVRGLRVSRGVGDL